MEWVVLRRGGGFVAWGAALALVAAACGDDAKPAGNDVADAADAAGADDVADAGEGGDTAGPLRCRDYNPTRNAYFGDLHVHTRLSLDANLQGTRLSPAEAYRFARGEEVGIQPHRADGTPLRRLRLDRPLDFAAVTDHAEFLGTVNVCTTPGTPGYDDPDCEMYRDAPDSAFFLFNLLVANGQNSVEYPLLCGERNEICEAPMRLAWEEIKAAAAAAQDTTDACTFTSFVGYEWSGAPGAANLHRNVIFANEHVPELPISYFEEPWPEGLWARLRSACDAIPTCRVLAIPHNSNLSSGLMFEAKKRDGSPIDRAFAEAQAAMEPLVEIMQHKGDSECLPGGSMADEYCSFEKLPYRSLAGANLGVEIEPVPQDYVQHALLQGLQFQRTLGVNPWRFGIMASTDTHLGTPGATSERTYPGHGGAGAAARDALPAGLVDDVAFNPGGLVGVWAEENGRTAIFDALARRETWGTSGPRIAVRFFGGAVDAAWCDDPELAAKAYAAAVPMGGMLPSGAPARFLVAAQRDPGSPSEPGAALARIQLVKGWVDAEGALQTRVFEVAGGDDGLPDPDPVTCNVPEGGHARLCGVVEDPDFDAARPAFWYARVIERPTCRWSTYQCVAAGVDCTVPENVPEAFAGCCDARYPKLLRERAWTSPIWFEP
jgi:hypothetical protein